MAVCKPGKKVKSVKVHLVLPPRSARRALATCRPKDRATLGAPAVNHNGTAMKARVFPQIRCVGRLGELDRDRDRDRDSDLILAPANLGACHRVASVALLGATKNPRVRKLRSSLPQSETQFQGQQDLFRRGRRRRRRWRKDVDASSCEHGALW